MIWLKLILPVFFFEVLENVKWHMWLSILAHTIFPADSTALSEVYNYTRGLYLGWGPGLGFQLGR